MCGGEYCDNGWTRKNAEIPEASKYKALNFDPGYAKASEICRDFDGVPYEVIRNSVFPDFND